MINYAYKFSESSAAEGTKLSFLNGLETHRALAGSLPKHVKALMPPGALKETSIISPELSHLEKLQI